MANLEIERLIREVLCIDNDVSDLGYDVIPEWSSSSHINVIIALEEHFSIEFDADEIVEMTSIPAIEAIVMKRVSVGD